MPTANTKRSGRLTHLEVTLSVSQHRVTQPIVHTMLKESDIARHTARRNHRTYTPAFKAKIVAACLERSEEHTSKLQSLMRITYDVFCLKNKKQKIHRHTLYKQLTKT